MTMLQALRKWTLPLIASITVLFAMTAGVLANSGGGLPGWGDYANDGLKAGPLGLNPALDDGQVPVAIRIADADVDAEVEQQEIVNGQMLDPSGPWVVSWYKQTAMVGAVGNTVMSGHVDYWEVGPSVFWEVANLQQGARIDVVGEDGTIYVYEVEYVERVFVAELTAETINSPELVGQTDYAALTLITCGGDFDRERGEYLSRDIIRGKLVETVAPDGSTTGADTQPAAETESEEPAESAGTLTEGGQATVTEDGVNVRGDASTSAEAVTTVSSGTTVTITGASQEGDGFVWWPVELEDGTTGWIVEDFLEAAG